MPVVAVKYIYPTICALTGLLPAFVFLDPVTSYRWQFTPIATDGYGWAIARKPADLMCVFLRSPWHYCCLVGYDGVDALRNISLRLPFSAMTAGTFYGWIRRGQPSYPEGLPPSNERSS